MNVSLKSCLFLLFISVASLCFGDFSNKVLVFEVADDHGELQVGTCYCRQYHLSSGVTEDEWLQRILKNQLAVGGGWALVEICDVPSQLLLTATVIKDGCVVIDVEILKRLRMNKIRWVRNCLLQKSDIDLLVAMENNNDVEMQLLKARRQSLRDIPETFDMSPYVTVDLVLHSAIPIELGLGYEEFENYTDVALTRKPKQETRMGKPLEIDKVRGKMI